MKTGLVLSGGASRGVSHLGVLSALEAMGVEIGAISGSSAGAIIGALYAGGTKPKEILEIIREHKFFNLPGFSLLRNGFFSHQSIGAMLQKHLKLQTFEASEIQLFVWATNLNTGQPQEFSSGDLIPPIIASSSVPVLFDPVRIGHDYYTDGGVMNIFPVESLIGNCDVIIGSNLNAWPQMPEFWNRKQFVQRCFQLAMSIGLEEKKKKCHVLIDPPIGHFNPFVKKELDKIYEAGFSATMEKESLILNLTEEMLNNP